MTLEMCDYYVLNTSEFRKLLYEAKNLEEFILIVEGIPKGYQLKADNRYDVPFEEIHIMEDNSLKGCFYLHGGIKYKTYKSLSKKVYLKKYGGYNRTCVIL